MRDTILNALDSAGRWAAYGLAYALYAAAEFLSSLGMACGLRKYRRAHK